MERVGEGGRQMNRRREQERGGGMKRAGERAREREGMQWECARGVCVQVCALPCQQVNVPHLGVQVAISNPDCVCANECVPLGMQVNVCQPTRGRWAGKWVGQQISDGVGECVRGAICGSRVAECGDRGVSLSVASMLVLALALLGLLLARFTSSRLHWCSSSARMYPFMAASLRKRTCAEAAVLLLELIGLLSRLTDPRALRRETGVG
eukprot:5079307-Pleurochrysis_carterae.AAC.1